MVATTRSLPHDIVRETLTELEVVPIARLMAARGQRGHACDSGRCPVARYLLDALADGGWKDDEVLLRVGANSVTLTSPDFRNPWRMEILLPVVVAEWIEQFDLGRHPHLLAEGF